LLFGALREKAFARFCIAAVLSAIHVFTAVTSRSHRKNFFSGDPRGARVLIHFAAETWYVLHITDVQILTVQTPSCSLSMPARKDLRVLERFRQIIFATKRPSHMLHAECCKLRLFGGLIWKVGFESHDCPSLVAG